MVSVERLAFLQPESPFLANFLWQILNDCFTCVGKQKNRRHLELELVPERVSAMCVCTHVCDGHFDMLPLHSMLDLINRTLGSVYQSPHQSIV